MSSDIAAITGEVLLRLDRGKYPIVCNISNRHIHLSEKDLGILFGSGYKLEKMRDLLQPGEFASTVTVDLQGPKGLIKKVRVLGPCRSQSQAEVSLTDTFTLGIKTEVRDSGDIAGSAGGRLIGPAGSVDISEGIIVARRHIHMTTAHARKFKLKDKQIVRVRTLPPRSVVFEDVLVRVNDNYALECHLDTDEANACSLKNGSYVYLS